MGMIHRTFESIDSLNHEAAACLSDYVRLQGQGRYGVMLSGGNTPLAAYELVRAQGPAAGPDLTLLYSDERDVPVNSPESNYGATLPLIQSLGLPGRNVIRVKTELGWRDSADRYDHDLRWFLESGAKLKLGFLGLGPDGHTASLFTPADVTAGLDHYAVAIARVTKPDRVSVTPDLLRRVERLIILAAGVQKREMVTNLIRHPDQVVAGMALRGAPSVELWQAPA